MFRPSSAIASLALLLAATSFTGCIKNDIPYPRVHANILELQVAYQSQPTQIDSVARIATVYLTEQADIYAVSVEHCVISDAARFVGPAIEGTIDLSEPRHYVLEIYQQYDWTLQAVQQIDRYFTVANQIGAADIDPAAHTVTVTLPTTADLSAVRVEAAKLGSSSSTMTPDPVGSYIDLSQPYALLVSDYGRTVEWTVSAITSEATVTTLSVDAWTSVAWVYGQARAGRHNTVEYRRADSSDWITAPDSWITSAAGDFHARITGLESLTRYVARCVSDSDKANEIEFTTGAIIQVPNSDFENWWLDGKVWCPWAEDGLKYWDTGNRGAATLGQSNTVPTDDTPSGSGLAAKLETRFVGIGFLGKLAAGNIFIGDYVRTDGTNGILSFGRPFTERPTKLRGYFKYHSAPISSTTAGFEQLKNMPDTCIIWAALTDDPDPLEIRTNPANRQLFDPAADYVVAYGKMEVGQDVDSYTPFEFNLDYRAADRTPRYIMIVASASKYGDYFTGGNGSVLFVDDLQLLYDY